VLEKKGRVRYFVDGAVLHPSNYKRAEDRLVSPAGLKDFNLVAAWIRKV